MKKGTPRLSNEQYFKVRQWFEANKEFVKEKNDEEIANQVLAELHFTVAIYTITRIRLALGLRKPHSSNIYLAQKRRIEKDEALAAGILWLYETLRVANTSHYAKLKELFPNA